jgi:TPR repeat protein
MPWPPILIGLLALLVFVIFINVKEDESEELKNLRKKAEANDPASMLELADCYGLGRLGAARSISRSMTWLEKAALSEDPEVRKKSSSKLAFLFSFGVGEWERPEEALKWSERAYKLGDNTAMILCAHNHKRLGNIKMAYQYALAEARWSHDRGKIEKVEADYEKLIPSATRKIYRKEAEALDPLKMMNARADEVLLKSLAVIAMLGDADSQYEMGMHHLKGEMGLPKSRENAIGWFRRAAANGHQKAIKKLAELAGLK